MYSTPSTPQKSFSLQLYVSVEPIALHVNAGINSMKGSKKRKKPVATSYPPRTKQAKFENLPLPSTLQKISSTLSSSVFSSSIWKLLTPY
jgi:hypothetical protein